MDNGPEDDFYNSIRCLCSLVLFGSFCEDCKCYNFGQAIYRTAQSMKSLGKAHLDVTPNLRTDTSDTSPVHVIQ